MRRGLWLSLAGLAVIALATALLRRPPAQKTLPTPPPPAANVLPAQTTPPPPQPAGIPKQYRGRIIAKRVRYFPSKLLALTIDDGPDPQITPIILKTLKQYNARATFFVVGRKAKAYPALVKREVAEGHAVESHSWSHPASTSPARAASELANTAAIIQKLTGRKPELFRPPYGITNGNLSKLAQKQGYGVVLWTISTADSNPIGPKVIARNVIHTPNPGDFVLMHDGAGHTATAQALPQVLRELSAEGFQFVTLPELLRQWARWQQQVKSTPPRK
jgi:peptidoglycan/xylan/chitin deacetylase (PgdA/CDA1 family)